MTIRSSVLVGLLGAGLAAGCQPAPAAPPEIADLAAARPFDLRGSPADLGAPDLRPRADLATDPEWACTSMDVWVFGNLPTPLMHPGMACLECHSRGRGPNLRLGGTVFPRLHEPDDCAGQSGVTVEITDANDQVVTMTTNAGGNFLYTRTLVPPYRARVRFAGREAAMKAPQMSGDCNSCHSQQGENGAPGRIVAP